MEGIGLESRRSPNILVPKGLWALLDTRISEAHLVRLWKCLLENIDKAKIREHINLCMVTKRSMDVAHKQARLGNYEESQKLFGICLLVGLSSCSRPWRRVYNQTLGYRKNERDISTVR